MLQICESQLDGSRILPKNEWNGIYKHCKKTMQSRCACTCFSARESLCCRSGCTNSPFFFHRVATICVNLATKVVPPKKNRTEQREQDTEKHGSLRHCVYSRMSNCSCHLLLYTVVPVSLLVLSSFHSSPCPRTRPKSLAYS
jgi:hypothetical protein